MTTGPELHQSNKSSMMTSEKGVANQIGQGKKQLAVAQFVPSLVKCLVPIANPSST